jgi:hypothetical protein
MFIDLGDDQHYFSDSLFAGPRNLPLRANACVSLKIGPGLACPSDQFKLT